VGRGTEAKKSGAALRYVPARSTNNKQRMLIYGLQKTLTTGSKGKEGPSFTLV
jgi:hypothetical protein